MPQCWACQQEIQGTWSEVTRPNKYGKPVKFIIESQSGLPHDCNRTANTRIRNFQVPRISYTTEQYRIMRMDRENRAQIFDPSLERYPADLFILKGFDDRTGQPMWERNNKYHDKEGYYIL